VPLHWRAVAMAQGTCRNAKRGNMDIARDIGKIGED
jgi:hypothetical protein